MWSNLLRIAANRPDLVASHVSGYLDLAQAELRETKRRWVLRVVAGAVSLVGLVVSLALVGVSVTLGSTGVAQWSLALFAAPLVAIVITVFSALYAFGTFRNTPPSAMAAQIRADLHAVSADLR